MSDLHPQLSHHTKEAENQERAVQRAAAEGRLNMVDGPVTGNTERTAGAASDGSQHDMDAVQNRV